jgi:hypothetical protein
MNIQEFIQRNDTYSGSTLFFHGTRVHPSKFTLYSDYNGENSHAWMNDLPRTENER